jgi:hypothetical protein
MTVHAIKRFGRHAEMTRQKRCGQNNMSVSSFAVAPMMDGIDRAEFRFILKCETGFYVQNRQAYCFFEVAASQPLGAFASGFAARLFSTAVRYSCLLSAVRRQRGI